MTALADSHENGCQSIDEARRRWFGFPDFRPGQRRAIELVMSGRDALVVMPTGSGKSLCYQLPALLRPGVTLVVSPLIALMKDQVDALVEHGIPAAYVNSTVTGAERRETMQRVVSGELRLLYVAPERLRDMGFCHTLARADVSMLVVDEAHCVSQWGHDFRPDYLRIGDARAGLGARQTVAVTATATRFVQKDVLDQLRIPDAEALVSGFARPNLFFEVYPASSNDRKHERMLDVFDHYDGESCIVYGATRKQVESVAARLVEAGICADYYHGGRSEVGRARVQEAWMTDEVDVLVATNAFGMGVDKPDVRAVIHYNMPGSVEAYYQEAGRAGRDGKPATCLLLSGFDDDGIHRFFIENKHPSREHIEEMWARLCEMAGSNRGASSRTVRANVDALARTIGPVQRRLHPMGARMILRRLRKAGYVRRTKTRDSVTTIELEELVDVAELDLDWEAQARRREIAFGQLDDILAYVSHPDCLHDRLVRYFDGASAETGACGHCCGCMPVPPYLGEPEPTADDEVIRLVRILLSAVARMEGDWGAHMVASVLRGAKTEKLLGRGLDRQSVYGLLEDRTQKQIVEMLKRIEEHQLIERNEHRCLMLTTWGTAVMTAKSPVWKRVATDVRDAASSDGTDRFSRRSETLSDTLELVRDGHRVAEVARIRELSSRTVFGHLFELFSRGEEFPIQADLDPSILDGIALVAPDWEPGDPLTPIRDTIDPDLEWGVLKTHLLAHAMERGERSDDD